MATKKYNTDSVNPKQKTKLEPTDKYYDLSHETRVINVPKDYTKKDIEKLKENLKALTTIELGNGFKLRVRPPKLIFSKKW